MIKIAMHVELSMCIAILRCSLHTRYLWIFYNVCSDLYRLSETFYIRIWNLFSCYKIQNISAERALIARYTEPVFYRRIAHETQIIANPRKRRAFRPHTCEKGRRMLRKKAHTASFHKASYNFFGRWISASGIHISREKFWIGYIYKICTSPYARIYFQK